MIITILVIFALLVYAFIATIGSVVYCVLDDRSKDKDITVDDLTVCIFFGWLVFPFCIGHYAWKYGVKKGLQFACDQINSIGK